MDNTDENKTKYTEKKTTSNDSQTDIDKALKSFSCYLYTGKGYPSYTAIPWKDHDRKMMGEYLETVQVLASNRNAELVPIDKIKLAMDSKLISQPQTLMFALALCARQKKSEKLRAAAYYFLAEHCREWKYFILFIKYASILSRMDRTIENDNTRPSVSWGHGLKSAVNNWYLTQDIESLCELITLHKGDCGWKHKDMIKLSHPDPVFLEGEMQAILCYIVCGLEHAENKYGRDPEAKKTLEYISSLENMKRCEDPEVVAKLIQDRQFSIKQAHPKMLKSIEVWQAAVPTMDIWTILKRLPRLIDLGFLTKSSPVTSLIAQALTDENSLRWNKIMPADILAVLQRCDKAFSHLRKKSIPKTTSSKTALNTETSDVRRMVGNSNLRGRTKKKPDIKIRDALRAALNIARTVDITGSSKRTYLVAVRRPTVPSLTQYTEACIATALPLMNRDDCPESAVTLIRYEPDSVASWRVLLSKVTKDMSFEKASQLFERMQTEEQDETEEQCTAKGLLEWAVEKNKKFDVVINITTETPSINIITSMIKYREAMHLPNARLVNIIINPEASPTKGDIWHEALMINGFDPQVPWIIEAYSRGLF